MSSSLTAALKTKDIFLYSLNLANIYKITVKGFIFKKHAAYLNLYFLIHTFLIDRRFRLHSYSCCVLKTPFSKDIFSSGYTPMDTTACNTEMRHLV